MTACDWPCDQPAVAHEDGWWHCADHLAEHREITKPDGHSKGGRPRLPEEHGSERGFQQHRAAGTLACDPCTDAHRTYNSVRRVRVGAS